MTVPSTSLFRALASLLLAGSLAACVSYGGGAYRYGGGYASRRFAPAWHGSGGGSGHHGRH